MGNVLLLWAFSIYGVCVRASEDFTEEDIDDLEIKFSIWRHDVLSSNMRYLAWNKGLATDASDIVNDCKIDDIAAGIAVNTYVDINGAVKLIYTKWDQHSPDSNVSGANETKCKKAGGSCAYMQVIEPESRMFGCARKHCSDKFMVVCIFEKKYDADGIGNAIKLGEACTECSDAKSKCYNRLCMSEELCKDDKYKKYCTCAPPCKYNFQEDENCNCSCRLKCQNGGTLDIDRCRCKCKDQRDKTDECTRTRQSKRSGSNRPFLSIGSILVAAQVGSLINHMLSTWKTDDH